DPFSNKSGISSLFSAILATTLFRCWHIILFFSGWATMVALISDKVRVLSLPSTLITVFGTVLGFVISYRTSSSFERYNEGRRYWSSIILASRVLARTIWIHVPREFVARRHLDYHETENIDATEKQKEQIRLKAIVEKKSAINLIDAFAVSVKHYLRGEETIFYEDLYHHVKFLPVYMLPAGMPQMVESPIDEVPEESLASATSAIQTEINLQSPAGSQRNRVTYSSDARAVRRAGTTSTVVSTFPAPQEVESSTSTPAGTLYRKEGLSIDIEKAVSGDATIIPMGPRSSTSRPDPVPSSQAGRLQRQGSLLPASDPPKWAMFDVFPLSLFIKPLLKKGKNVAGKKAAKLKAKEGNVNHNIPLEITFYLSSYIAEIQRRKIADVPTLNLLLANLNLLSDSLTGLERIQTTPIPFSYSIHLWTVATIFVALLPFQLWTTFHYSTIPATAIAAFIFFGFLAAGDEIENPFGYDKNDLNLDHFTRNIIRVELAALTSRPPPSLEDWALSPDNNNVFGKNEAPLTPREWMERGEQAVWGVLKKGERGMPQSAR
ncbi:hypothetical protein M407DRAFT_66439, partial [Tulasnella calospora MUT 4182]